MAKEKVAKSTKKKVGDIISTVLLSLLAIFAVLIIVEKATGFSITGYHVVYVKTDSMEPVFNHNSFILTKDVNGDKVEVGDIVTFYVKDPNSPIKGQYNTHEIIEIDPENKLITKGTNNPMQDAYHVDRNDVSAKYVKNLKVLSGIVGFLATPIGYGLITTVIVGGTATLIVINHYKQKKADMIDKLVKEEVEKLELENAKKKGKKNGSK